VSLVDAVRFQLTGRAGSGSPLDPDSLSRRTLELWLGQDPWPLGAATVLVPVGLAIRRLRPVTAAFVILAAMVLRPGYLPVPLVIGMLPFANLLVAGVADTAWGWSASRTRAAATTGRGAVRSRALGPILVVACLAAVAVAAAPHWRRPQTTIPNPIRAATCRPMWPSPTGRRPLTGGPPEPSVMTCDRFAGLV
jgi:hypothetical protein